jgi:transcriptional regulator with XRE-family HTH domain
VEQLFAMSGYDTIAEFASRAGLFGPNVGEYRSGKTMPDGYTLLKLMDAAGATLQARGGAVDVPGLAAPRALRGEQQEVVDEVLRQIREQVLPDLDDVRARVERLEAGPTQTTRQATDG